MNKAFLNKIDKYYTEKIKQFGATSKGVDWNGKDSHFLRFNQLTKVFNSNQNFSVLDYGCGYGSLTDYLDEQDYSYTYTGFDISCEMIKKANLLYQKENIFFTSENNKLRNHDYVIANGIFNIKLEFNKEEWKQYVIDTIGLLDKYATKGFAFNILTSYSDVECQKDYLYYANPLLYFDYCKNNFSKNVALLHDYNLYEFTIIVRK